MDEIRVHAEKKRKKFLTPAAGYSPVIQHWYDRIYTYVDLLKLKQGTCKNTNKGNAVISEIRLKVLENPISGSV